MGQVDHKKAYQFQEIKSDRMLVSRDAHFMEDVFDSGRRIYIEAEVVLDDDGLTDGALTKKKKMRGVKKSKRKQATRSLQEAVEEEPQAKRPSRHQGLEEVSAVDQESHAFKAAFVMDSVGEMPTTSKSASGVVKWKESCSYEMESLCKNKICSLAPLPKGR